MTLFIFCINLLPNKLQYETFLKIDDSLLFFKKTFLFLYYSILWYIFFHSCMGRFSYTFNSCCDLSSNNMTFFVYFFYPFLVSSTIVEGSKAESAFWWKNNIFQSFDLLNYPRFLYPNNAFLLLLQNFNLALMIYETFKKFFVSKKAVFCSKK